MRSARCTTPGGRAPTNYGDEANTTDRDTWSAIAYAIIDDEIDRDLVIRLGPCAAVDVPRALFLLEWTDEGGPSGRALPSSFDDWPVADSPTSDNSTEDEC